MHIHNIPTLKDIMRQYQLKRRKSIIDAMKISKNDAVKHIKRKKRKPKRETRPCNQLMPFIFFESNIYI